MRIRHAALSRPGKAVAEAYRVLRPGGQFAFSLWCGPAKAKVLTLIADAVQRHADGTVALPAGPGIFMLSDPWKLTALMEAAKFTDVRIDELPCFFAPTSASAVFDMMRKSMVRATYIYERQTADVQHRIEHAIKDEVQGFGGRSGQNSVSGLPRERERRPLAKCWPKAAVRCDAGICLLFFQFRRTEQNPEC